VLPTSVDATVLDAGELVTGVLEIGSVVLGDVPDVEPSAQPQR
jgi:hypothetical protein